MKPSRRPSGEAGFTLIEALIAIIVLVFGLIAITNLFVVATASNQIGNLTTAAAVRSSETLEKLKSIPFTALAPGGSLTADAGTANTTPEVLVGGALTYHCQENVTGVGLVRSRWLVSATNAAGNDVYFITVRSEVDGPFGRQLSRAEYSTFRTCTTRGCPNVPVS
jgi:Tfp pilus assembly protein PilV